MNAPFDVYKTKQKYTVLTFKIVKIYDILCCTK